MNFLCIILLILFKILPLKACIGGGLNPNKPKPDSILPFNQSGCGFEPLSINSDLSDKIINGESAPLDKWPWMVSLRARNLLTYAHFCGGVIISAQHILTAAHCIITDVSNMIVVAGNENLNDPIQNNKYEVYKAVIHPEYKKITDGKDIAVLILLKPIKYTKSIYSICVPTSDDSNILIGKETIAIGWGSTSGINSPNALSNRLQQLTMEIKNPDFDKCESLTQNYCAIAKYNQNANICYGDSGGPLIFKKSDNKFYVYGVASFVKTLGTPPVCVPSEPSFFTKVPNTFRQVLENL